MNERASEGYVFGEYIPMTAAHTPISLAQAREQVNTVPPSTWLPHPEDHRTIYYEQRKRCPNCDGREGVSQTLVGYIFDPNQPHKYKDENRAICHSCGWVGIVHDMKPL